MPEIINQFNNITEWKYVGKKNTFMTSLQVGSEARNLVLYT